MHELFLTAVVANADVERARALLQGLCGMDAYVSTHRVLYFSGPPQPRGLPNRRLIPAAQGRLWAELNQQLSRQSYVLQLRYAVSPETDFVGTTDTAPLHPGAGGLQAMANTAGTLRWTDFPDPTGGSSASDFHRLVTQRSKIEIPDTHKLPGILYENNYRFKSELVEESYTFFSSGTEYTLVRHHRLPPAPPMPVNNGPPQAQPLASLPAWNTVTGKVPGLMPVDPSGQWLLFVRRHVVDDASPDKMKKALEQLEAVRTQLAGAFAFRAVDRRAHDTRIERSINNMPAPLPQKLRA